MAALSVPHACRRLLGCETSMAGVLKGAQMGNCDCDCDIEKLAKPQADSKSLPLVQFAFIYRNNQKFNAKSIFDMAFTLTAPDSTKPCASYYLLRWKVSLSKIVFTFLFLFFFFFFSFFLYNLHKATSVVATLLWPREGSSQWQLGSCCCCWWNVTKNSSSSNNDSKWQCKSFLVDSSQVEDSGTDSQMPHENQCVCLLLRKLPAPFASRCSLIYQLFTKLVNCPGSCKSTQHLFAR